MGLLPMRESALPWLVTLPVDSDIPDSGRLGGVVSPDSCLLYLFDDFPAFDDPSKHHMLGLTRFPPIQALVVLEVDEPLRATCIWPAFVSHRERANVVFIL